MILGIFLVGVMVGMAVTATAIFALREVRQAKNHKAPVRTDKFFPLGAFFLKKGEKMSKYEISYNEKLGLWCVQSVNDTTTGLFDSPKSYYYFHDEEDAHTFKRLMEGNQDG